MKRLWAAGLAVLGLSATPALAEKLKGNIWDVDPLVVEGTEVVVSADTRVVRKGHPNVAAADLGIGWRVEIEGEADGDGRWLAERIEIETARGKKVDVEGYVDALGQGELAVEGRRILWAGPEGRTLRAGAYLEGEGRLRDDGTVEIEEAELRDRDRDGGRGLTETKYLALAALEREGAERGLRFHEDSVLVDYLGGVARSLVPEWADREELRFDVRVVEDDEPNLLAFPDGTLFIHSGLLAALENEAQLAVLLAHVLAHVVHEHGYRRYRQSRRPAPGKRLGAVVSASTVDVYRPAWTGPSWAADLAELGAIQVVSCALDGYGAEEETAADRIGLGYAVAAGYDPFEGPRLWESLSRYVSHRDSESLWFLADLITHRARFGATVQELNARYRDVVEPGTLRRGETEYARRVAGLVRLDAVAHYARGELEAAKWLLRRLLELDAGDAVAHLYLGKVLWDTRGSEGADVALGELRLATELAPALAECYREMGFIYRSLGYHESAAAAFERYVDLAPHAEDASEVRRLIQRSN